MFIGYRLTSVFKRSLKNEIDINDRSKLIFFSDCHRGDSGWADDFSHNKNIFFRALIYYFKKGFTYIEVGDGDELWKNKDFTDIREAYLDIFKLLKKFYEAGRFHMIWGNHNVFWKKIKNVKKYLREYYSERRGKLVVLFKDIIVHEGIVLKYKNKKNKIFIVHGHQGEIFNDFLWWVFKFLSRYFWKPLQMFGLSDRTSPAKNYKVRDKIEKKIKEWVDKNNQFTIVGHTHRSIFPEVKDPPFFNTGSCVHPQCITGIEIENGKISLIKWYVNIKDNGFLFIDREVLDGPVKLTSFFNSKRI